MKINKRMQHSIIIQLFFFSILLFITLYFLITFSYKNILFIEDKKAETRELYNELVESKKHGITYEEFQEYSKGNQGDSEGDQGVYKKELLNNITKEFYNRVFPKENINDFHTYITELDRELKSDKNKKKREERDMVVSHILPTYSSYYQDPNDQPLTDFTFINYIESILYTFGLENTQPLGVKKLVILDEYRSKDNKSDDLEGDIFAIPVKLDLVGSKEGMINFLHFIENVGNIALESLDNEVILSAHSDRFLYKGGLPIVLSHEIGKKPINTYNIYENQIIDVQQIKFNRFINSSVLDYSDTSQGINFYDFIKKDQGYEKTQASVILDFYVIGYPSYEIQNAITQIVDDFYKLKKHKKLQGSSVGLDRYNMNMVNSIKQYFKDQQKNIKNIQKLLKSGGNLESMYLDALEIKTVLDSYKKYLDN